MKKTYSKPTVDIASFEVQPLLSATSIQMLVNENAEKEEYGLAKDNDSFDLWEDED